MRCYFCHIGRFLQISQMRTEGRNDIGINFKPGTSHTKGILDVILAIEAITMRHNIKNLAIRRNLPHCGNLFNSR
ncbi:hypothetical protein D3C72_2066300 [compost metagenome]